MEGRTKTKKNVCLRGADVCLRGADVGSEGTHSFIHSFTTTLDTDDEYDLIKDLKYRRRPLKRRSV